MKSTRSDVLGDALNKHQKQRQQRKTLAEEAPMQGPADYLDERAQEHGPQAIAYKNLGAGLCECVIFCACGEELNGDTFEEAGRAFDEHLEGR